MRLTCSSDDITLYTLSRYTLILIFYNTAEDIIGYFQLRVEYSVGVVNAMYSRVFVFTLRH